MTVEEFAKRAMERIEDHFLRAKKRADECRKGASNEDYEQAYGIATGLSIAQNSIRNILKETTAVPTAASENE